MPLLADTCDFGKPASTQAHGFSTTGTVRAERLETEMGDWKRGYAVQTVQGTGSGMRLTLAAPRHPGPAILEIQEIHQRRPQAFGYTVSVNGQPVYFRTYEELGAGPNHYFVRIPDALLTPGDALRVELTSAGAPPFSLGQVWLYNDFFGWVDSQEKIYRPMAITSMRATAKLDESPLRSFWPLGDFDPPNFARHATDQSRATVSRYLEQSGRTGRPVQILLNGPTWGGQLTGPDGRGGYFTDLRYNLTNFHPATGDFNPSFPNMWSSSFWASFQEPHQNAMIARRLRETLRDVPATLDFLKARGQAPTLYVARDLGPPLGEITADTIAEAAREGVVLDPRDGLSQPERLWLYRDSVQLWKEYSAQHREAFGRDSIGVDRGEVRLPAEQLLDHQYAHTIFRTPGPMKDPRWFGGQTGMVDGLWSSGELFWKDTPLYDYAKANGKLAHVNLTVTVLKNDATPLRDLYAGGFQFVNLYQDTEAFMASVRRADGCEAEPALDPVHAEPTVFNAPYHLDESLGDPARLVETDNLRIHSQVRANADAHASARLAVIDVNRPGHLTYRLDNGGEPFPAPLSLRLDGRISPGPGNRIEVLVGPDLGSLRSVASLTDRDLPCPDHWEPYMTSKTTVDLGNTMVGQNQTLVRLVLHASAAPDAAFLMDCHIGSQWQRRSGHFAGNPFNKRQQRTLELWIQERAVADAMLRRYRREGGSDVAIGQAQTLIAQARYRSAQTFLSGELSSLLPARFAVRGHGPLGRYPVTVALPRPDDVLQVTLHAVSPDAVEFSARSEQGEQPFTLSVPAAEGSHWSLTRLPNQRYRLALSPDGSPVPVAAGRATAALVANAPDFSRPRLPRTFAARLLEVSAKTLRVDSQDLELMNHEEALTLRRAATVQFTRTAERLVKPSTYGELPRRFDRVALTLNAQDEVVAVHALYGHDTGEITRVTAPSIHPPYSNGSIELDHERIYSFSYDTELETVAMHGRYCDYEISALTTALKPGQRVSLDYSPYAEGGTERRLIRVAQPHRVLFEQDYTQGTDETFRAAAVSVAGLQLRPHKPEPNYLHHIIKPLVRPVKAFEPGTVVYRVRSDRPLKTTVVEFAARAFEDSTALDFAVSLDGQTWTECGRFDNRWLNSYPQPNQFGPWIMPWKFIDLTPHVAGQSGFFVKLSFRVNSADERACLSALRVVTE
jgi:hypothetical protein